MVYDCIDLNSRIRRVPYFSLVDKLKEKKKLKKKLDQFNTYLKSYGLAFNKIQIYKHDINNEKDFDLEIESKEPAGIDKVALCQTARDVSLMSEKAYNKFRKTINPIAKIVSLAKCNAYKKKVNEFWAIGNNLYGSFILEPLKKITDVCEKYIDKMGKKTPPEPVKDNTLNIQLCGDGVMITKTHLNILNFTFSLLNDIDLSLNGFYSLGF